MIVPSLYIECYRSNPFSSEILLYQSPYVKELEMFYTSDTMKFSTYIFENDWRNKVNKYSLFIVGKTIFDDKFEINLMVSLRIKTIYKSVKVLN